MAVNAPGGTGSDIGLFGGGFNNQNMTPMRNSVGPGGTQITMKTYEQLVAHFSKEAGLEYVDQFVYQNNSVYRGQMKKVDEAMR